MPHPDLVVHPVVLSRQQVRFSLIALVFVDEGAVDRADHAYPMGHPRPELDQVEIATVGDHPVRELIREPRLGGLDLEAPDQSPVLLGLEDTNRPPSPNHTIHAPAHVEEFLSVRGDQRRSVDR